MKSQDRDENSTKRKMSFIRDFHASLDNSFCSLRLRVSYTIKIVGRLWQFVIFKFIPYSWILNKIYNLYRIRTADLHLTASYLKYLCFAIKRILHE